jgi:hypothetical protein
MPTYIRLHTLHICINQVAGINVKITIFVNIANFRRVIGVFLENNVVIIFSA